MDKRLYLAVGCAGLTLGLALSLGDGIGLGAIANWGFVVGALGGGLLAFGLARMLAKRR
jgi:hypothetical protein